MTAPARRAPATCLPATYLPGLDAARALGAAAVVATHTAFFTGRDTHGPLFQMLARLDVGVAIFFVLSGFLLFRPYVLAHHRGRPWPATATYLRRRAQRILPAYWLVVGVALLALTANRSEGTGGWLRQVTLTQIYSGRFDRAGLSQTWSLATEVSFYLLLPLLASVVLRGNPRPALTLAALLVVPPLWRVYLAVDPRLLPDTGDLWLPGYLDWFALGMLLALVQVQGAGRSPGEWRRRLVDLAQARGLCWAGALVLLVVAGTPLAGGYGFVALTTPEKLVKHLLYGAIGLLVVLPLVLRRPDDSPTSRVLASRPVRWLGEISYGVFLCHLLVLQAVTNLRHQALFTGSWVLTFLLVWTLSLGVASLSYVALERPLLRLGSRRRPASGSSVDQSPASAPTQSS